jgi:hypothetical protein
MLSDCPASCQVAATVTINVTPPTPATAQCMTRTATGIGVVPSGASSISFFNYGPANVDINGTTLAQGAAINFPFLGNNITYGEMNYDATGSTIRIDWTIIV